MNVLITGGNGQLGQAFALVWPEAAIIDRHELDLTASDDAIITAIKQFKPEVVINCAAYTAVDQAEVEPALANQVNGLAVAAIARACQELDAWLVQISTDYVLSPTPPAGASTRLPDEPPAPLGTYGRSKLNGEAATLKYEHGRVIRTSWVYGQGQNFVRTMFKLSESHNMLEVVSDQIGRPTYAPDLALAIKRLVETGLDRLPLVLQIQNDGPVVSWADFARQIMAFSQRQTIIKNVTTADYRSTHPGFASRPELSVFDLQPVRQLGVTMPDWRDSLKSYLATLLK